ncbi:Deuterolysin metalloprotease family-domain-containing protein [Bombardia bombarda]|uniref:Neutral protease 2 n=1 Tax=Bombardia bombarda TaxID=252184 RepID=A0AA39T160_9PEZI|nr:Deuterolysin metalloprotease family-domain-containing protein [Bombardia bombarda]
MKFSLALFASVASAVSVDLSKRASPLAVEINVVDNSNVVASITNTGSTPLKVLKTGSILDNSHIEKTEIFSGAAKVPFDGIRLRIATSNLEEDSFQILAPGETVSTSWDTATVHDLSAGGEFSFSTSGAISYAEIDSNSLTGAVPFSSNVVTASVDGTAAAKVRRSFNDYIQKRTVVQSDCTSTRLTATRNAISSCRSHAAAASSAAVSGAAARMTEYFKSSTTATRSTVATVFGRIVTECGSTTSGVSRQYCSDVLSSCGSSVLAYTLPSGSYMVNCPLYFSALPAVTGTCHAQDQATTTLHEVTHLTQIRGTSDQSGCYGYSCVRSLTASQNLNHADTYSLFANAVRINC